MRALKICLLAMLVAVEYGILHDFFTASICKEYFTLGHRLPPVQVAWTPLTIALYFGITCTWWAGLASGCILSRFNQKLSLDRMMVKLQCLCLCGFLFATIAGIVGYNAAVAGFLVMPMRVESRIPIALRPRFLAVASAHVASYAFWFVVTLLIAVQAPKAATETVA